MAWPTLTIDTTNMTADTGSPVLARPQIKQMADNVNGIMNAKGAASGIAPLDAGGLVPPANLPVTPAGQGGTGQAGGYSVGDLLYASAAGTLTKLSAVTAGYVLTSNGPGVAPSWQLPGGGFTTGTRMSFNQTAAPTGWTKDTTPALNDSIMRIVTGTVGSGGSTAFSTFNGQTATAAYTLTAADIPSHVHQEQGASPTYGTPSAATASTGAGASGGSSILFASFSNGNGGTQGLNTVATGGGGAHSHGITTSILYNDFIIASKN